MADAVMTRATPFSYACGRCSRCCRDKGIALNPYEVLRLARNRGLTTTELIARFTERAGTLLGRRDDGACVFLGAAGCEVHPDRPLVCRIYPLARHISGEDEETFTELEPHPQTEGRYGRQGTVGDYLEAQGAGPFMQAADRYLNLFRALTDSLAARVAQLAAPERAEVEGNFVGPAEEAAPTTDWLDIDRTVEAHCRALGIAKPTQAAELMELHLQALSAWSSQLNEETS
jgi:Fe-S-cluster containining protein